MVILKQTEIKSKVEGIKKAAEGYEPKIQELNSKAASIEEMLKINIEKKSNLRNRIVEIIEKIRKEDNEESKALIIPLMRIKETLDNDIENDSSVSFPIIDSLCKMPVSDITRVVEKHFI